MPEPDVSQRRARRIAIVLIFACAAGALVVGLRQAWDIRESAANANLAQRQGKVLPGRTLDAREKIHTGMTEQGVLARLGQPTYRTSTSGTDPLKNWRFVYSDGAITVLLRSGYAYQIEADFN